MKELLRNARDLNPDTPKTVSKLQLTAEQPVAVEPDPQLVGALD